MTSRRSFLANLAGVVEHLGPDHLKFDGEEDA
jgi:hypothetical protein